MIRILIALVLLTISSMANAVPASLMQKGIVT